MDQRDFTACLIEPDLVETGSDQKKAAAADSIQFGRIGLDGTVHEYQGERRLESVDPRLGVKNHVAAQDSRPSASLHSVAVAKNPSSFFAPSTVYFRRANPRD
jgi:hypothetical protein